MSTPKYTEEQLNALSSEVARRMSEKRFLHTKGVVRAAERLAEYLLPEERSALVAAALLHDVAKELDAEELLRLAIRVEPTACEMPRAVLHSFAALAVIERDFPEFDEQMIKNAIKNHTLGSPDMSVFERIIFVADFIEENRSYKACIEMRDYVLSSLSDDINENILLIHKATLKILDFTLDFINRNNLFVVDKTVLAKAALERKIKQI